ncbi:hypothetical protein [Chondromyces crocatus]|nr:hypothetical protein [Chondromyces crocatus]
MVLLGIALVAMVAWRAPHAPDLPPSIAAEAHGAAVAGVGASVLLAVAALGWMRGRAWAPLLVIPCGLLFFSLAILLVAGGAGVTATGGIVPAQPLLVGVTALGLPLAMTAFAQAAPALSRRRVDRRVALALTVVLVIAAGLLWFIWGQVTVDLLRTGRSAHPYHQAGAHGLLWTAALVDAGFSSGTYLAGAWLLVRGGRAAVPAGFVALAYLAQHFAQAVVIEADRWVTGQPWSMALLGVSVVFLALGSGGATVLARGEIGRR